MAKYVLKTQADWQAGAADRVDVDPAGAVRLTRKNLLPNAALVDADANGIPDGWTPQLTNKIAYSVLPSDQGPFNRLRLDVLQDLTANDGWPGCEALGAGKELDLGNISGKPVSFRARMRVDNLTTGRFAIFCHWWLSDGTYIGADFGVIWYYDPRVNAGWFDVVLTRIAPTFEDGRYVKGIRYWRPGAREVNAGARLEVEQMQIELSPEPTPFSLYYHPTGTWTSQPIDLGTPRDKPMHLWVRADTPSGTSVAVSRIRTSNDGVNWGPWASLAAGLTPWLPQRFIQVEVTLATAETAESPTLHELTIQDWDPIQAFVPESIQLVGEVPAPIRVDGMVPGPVQLEGVVPE